MPTLQFNVTIRLDGRDVALWNAYRGRAAHLQPSNAQLVKALILAALRTSDSLRTEVDNVPCKPPKISYLKPTRPKP